MANIPKTESAYYMPLSSTQLQNGLKSPNPCTFSSPKITYSTETQNIIKQLMNECKLTSMQKVGFQSLLRSASSSAVNSGDSALGRRSQYAKNAFAKYPTLSYNEVGRDNFKLLGQFTKRSFDTIKSTGAYTPVNMTGKYVPCDKEEEKARLSYTMVHGHRPPNNNAPTILTPRKQSKKFPKQEKPWAEVKEDRFTELIGEIKDRIEFLRSMEQLKKEKQYKSYITTQIHDKLQEMKSLFPSRVGEIVIEFELMKIDSSFAKYIK